MHILKESLISNSKISCGSENACRLSPLLLWAENSAVRKDSGMATNTGAEEPLVFLIKIKKKPLVLLRHVA